MAMIRDVVINANHKAIERQLVTVIMPAFNEELTIREICQRVLQEDLVGQLIVIDDNSNDNTLEIASSIRDSRIQIIRHDKNRGKGAAIRSAQSSVKFPITLIQDADLEYDPSQYSKLVHPILNGYADVVYGSRFQTGEVRRVLYFWHYVGNKFLTLLSNALSNINLSDMETCYKAMESELFKRLSLKESRFGFEPELTAKLAAQGVRFYEVSISYFGRTYREGKKISAKDGFRAIYCIFKYNLLARVLGKKN